MSDRIGEYLAILGPWREKNADALRILREVNCRDYGSERRARVRAAFVAPVDRQAIFERDNWTCYLCDRPIDPAVRFPDSMSATVDHVIPLNRGGTHEPANVRAAHHGCNARKQDYIIGDDYLIDPIYLR